MKLYLYRSDNLVCYESNYTRCSAVRPLIYISKGRHMSPNVTCNFCKRFCKNVSTYYKRTLTERTMLKIRMLTANKGTILDEFLNEIAENK